MSKSIGTLRAEKGRAMQGQRDMRKVNRALAKELTHARALLSDVLEGFDSAMEEMRSAGEEIEVGALMLGDNIRSFLERE
jgi:hypothetical protein